MLNPLALIRVTLQRGNQQVAELYMGKRAIMKARLLAGVGFASAMNRGQTGYSAPDVSGWTGFAAPAFRLINQVEHYPLPCGLKPRCVHLTGYVGHFRVYFRLRHLECDRGEERKGERERESDGGWERDRTYKCGHSDSLDFPCILENPI